MKAESEIKLFGCTWIIDEVYTVPDEMMISASNPFGHAHKHRMKAHVIESPINYIGIREMDCALPVYK